MRLDDRWYGENHTCLYSDCKISKQISPLLLQANGKVSLVIEWQGIRVGLVRIQLKLNKK